MSWKEIPNTNGRYLANSKGQIKSCGGLVKHSKGGLQILKPRILKQTICKSGYSTVAISLNGIVKTRFVHRLIMSAFCGEKNMVVDHIDKNKSNNNLINLRYCTQRENTQFHKINPGISFNPINYKKRFRVRTRIKGKQVEIGNFLNLEDATIAYSSFQKNIKNGN
jgi:HNH endonuclease/NUMOD4 motif